MTRKEISETLIKILKDNLDEWENVTIDESSVLNTDTGVDSIRFIYVMSKVESTFSINIPERKWSKLITFGDVIDAIEEELKKK